MQRYLALMIDHGLFVRMFRHIKKRLFGHTEKKFFTLGEKENSPIFAARFVSVAQLVEQLTLNQRVHGSSPCGDTENEALTKPL